jgi:toxin FitB
VTGYLLDTNVVSELRKRERGDEHLRRWISVHLEDEFWLSVLVTGELLRGIELIARRDPSSAAPLREWFNAISDEFADRILPVTIAISSRWAVLSVPDPVPVVDGLLAATAIEHGLTLATRNVKDVARTGAVYVNPFEPS